MVLPDGILEDISLTKSSNAIVYKYIYPGPVNSAKNIESAPKIFLILATYFKSKSTDYSIHIRCPVNLYLIVYLKK